jgi:hypothetical protein
VDQADIDRHKAEIEEHGDITIRAKWSMDGATTLREAANKLRRKADWLEDLASAGFELNAPIQDDYGFVGHPDVVPRLDENDEELN